MLMNVWCCTSLSTLFKSYRDDGRVIMKGSVQWHTVIRWIGLPAGFKPGISWSEAGNADHSATQMFQINWFIKKKKMIDFVRVVPHSYFTILYWQAYVLRWGVGVGGVIVFYKHTFLVLYFFLSLGLLSLCCLSLEDNTKWPSRVDMSLTHCSQETRKRVIGKQCIP